MRENTSTVDVSSSPSRGTCENLIQIKGCLLSNLFTYRIRLYGFYLFSVFMQASMSPKRKRTLPTWMKGSVKPGLVSSLCTNNSDDIAPKSPILSVSNSSSMNRSSNDLVKENSFDLTGNMEHLSRCVVDTSAGEEDGLNEMTSTPFKMTFADSDKEENSELTEVSAHNNYKAALQSTRMEVNTVRNVPVDEDAEDQNGRNTPCSQENDIKDVGTDSGNNLQASVSASPATRKSCFYGSSCYRKNPQHRIDFAHPGDTDYCDSSNGTLGTNTGQSAVVTNDVRPLCEYGSACYRKNPQHRRDFRHDTPKKRNARPADLLDIPSDDDGDFNSGSESDNYNPGESESDDSFVTSDSMTDGNSDYDPEGEKEEKPKKRKRKQTQEKKGGKKVKGD